jgi:DNA polymerase-3 subunit epsilon
MILDRWCAFDTETSGVKVFDDHILSAAACSPASSGAATGSWLMCPHPDFEVPEGASAVNGLTTEMIREQGRPPVEVLTEISTRLAYAQAAGVPIVGHNLSFDLTILDANCRRHGVPTLGDLLGQTVGPCIDTMIIDRQLKPYRRRVSDTQGPYCLKTACQVWGIPWSDDLAHEASYDALQSARAAWRMSGAPEVAQMDLAELHAAQIQWATDQASSFAAWLRKQGKPADDVDGSWPIRMGAPA